MHGRIGLLHTQETELTTPHQNPQSPRKWSQNKLGSVFSCRSVKKTVGFHDLNAGDRGEFVGDYRYVKYYRLKMTFSGSESWILRI